jgi:hypothetical protein
MYNISSTKEMRWPPQLSKYWIVNKAIIRYNRETMNQHIIANPISTMYGSLPDKAF